MTDPPPDGKWPPILSLSAHELRNISGVVCGYLRMITKADILDQPYRRMLDESAKSCARLATLADEMSELSAMEAGKTKFTRGATVDLRVALADAIGALPSEPTSTTEVDLTTGADPATIHADGTRLKKALTAIVFGIRREVVGSDRLFVRERLGTFDGKPASWIVIGDPEATDVLDHSSPDAWTTFIELRGGCGLSLAIARRTIEAYGGRVWSPPAGSRAGAVIVLPHSTEVTEPR
jgi:signal transduction histidine kinase